VLDTHNESSSADIDGMRRDASSALVESWSLRPLEHKFKKQEQDL
jgi:hypothetical protein